LGTSRSPLLTSWLALRGLIRRDGARISLTPAGLDLASRLTRNHRLWERFMVRHAHLAASHVDLSADYVEHALPPELFAGLEDEFIKDSAPVPPSIHPIPRRP
jgi:manganese/zinc/iron transport system permease protein